MNDQTVETENALLVPIGQKTVAELFAEPEGIDAIIGRIELEARAHTPDLTTDKGRRAVASLAYKVARSKTALDEAGKQLNADRRAAIEKVDAERRKARERLDLLRDEVRKPLDEWEAAEEARVEDLKERLKVFDLGRVTAADTSEAIASVISQIKAAPSGAVWQEFEEEAEKRRANALFKLDLDLQQAQSREAVAAENERLRAELAEAKKAQEAREAEDARKAKEEADRKREEERLERERVEALEAEERRQREIQEAEERARVEAEAKAERDREEAAERIRLAEERAARAEREAEENRKREAEESERREVAAAERERERIAKEQRVAEAAQRQRDENKRMRNAAVKRVRRAIDGMSHDEIAEALVAGKIETVTVRI